MKKNKEEATVSSEQENNKALARRFLEPTARADLDAMDEMMAHEFAERSLMPGQEPDREGSRTRRRTAGSCAPWTTRSRRYGVSSAPAGRRSAYPELCVSHGWRGYRRGLSHPARLRCLYVQNQRHRRRHDQHYPDPQGRDQRHQGGADEANGHKDDGTGAHAARRVLAQPQGAEGQLRDRQQGSEVGHV